jgi:hypothetical protein
MIKSQTLDINGIREILAEEIFKLRKEETTASALNAVVNATGKILTTVKLEMEYAKLIGITPAIDFIKVKPLKPPKKLESNKKVEPKKSGEVSSIKEVKYKK